MKDKTRKLSYGFFAIILLLVSVYSANYPREAYAQTFQIVSGFAYPIKAMHYQADNDLIWVLTVDPASTKNFLYWINRSTQAIVGSFNHTNNIANGTLLRAEDIWCGKTDCFITSGQGSSAGQVVRISTEDINPNIFRGKNVTGRYQHSFGHMLHLTGRDQVSGGFGSITMWVDACNNPCTSTKINIVDGISMTLSGTLPQYNSGTDVIVHELKWSGIQEFTAQDNNLVTVVSGTTPNIAANHLVVYNLSTLAIKCDVQLPLISGQVALGLGIAPNYLNSGDVNNKIYVSANAGRVFVYDDNCSLKQTIVDSGALQSGLTTNVRFLEYGTGRIFAQEDGANAKISQMLTNSTGHIITNGTLYFPLPSSSQATFDGTYTGFNNANMILFVGFGKLWFPYTGTDKKIGILTYDAVSNQGTTVCIDTNPLQNIVSITCFEDVNGDGIPDSGLGEFPTVGQNTTTLVQQIACQAGIASCTNTDSKTNGIGLMLLLFLLLMAIGAIMFVTFRTDHSLSDIHPVVWFILVVACTGVSWQLGWTDAIPFFGSIVAICALGAFKVREWFG